MTHYLPEPDQAEEFNKLLASGAVVDTLIGLIENGPLEDGDVPSKNGRDQLIDQGCAQRIVVRGSDGFTAATLKGAALYRWAFDNADTLKQAKERRIALRAINSARAIKLKPISESAHVQCTNCTTLRDCKSARSCATHGINLWGTL